MEELTEDMEDTEEPTEDTEEDMEDMFLPQSAMFNHHTDIDQLIITQLQLTTHMLHLMEVLMEVHGEVPVDFMDQECTDQECTIDFISELLLMIHHLLFIKFFHL